MFQPTKIAHLQVVKKQFNGKEKECIIIKIDGLEYEECDQASENYWANSKPGVYGAGLGATADDKYKPVRSGLLGQMAFGKLTGLPVDTTYRKGGDQQDNLIGKIKIDIKCPMRNYGAALIYHTSEKGIKISLDKDIYVCSYIEQENRIEKTATVIMTGFALKQDVEKCEVKLGRKGSHMNYELPFDTLRPITKLVEAIIKRLAKS